MDGVDNVDRKALKREKQCKKQVKLITLVKRKYPHNKGLISAFKMWIMWIKIILRDFRRLLQHLRPPIVINKSPGVQFSKINFSIVS